MLLPAGTLREWHSGSKRANIIIVTKCPADISPIDMRLIDSELKPENNQLLFFSMYAYSEITPVFPDAGTVNLTLEQLKATQAGVLLVAGIVSPEPIVAYLQSYTDTIQTLFYSDHYAFQPKDFSAIKAQFEALGTDEKILLVTEKDAARLQSSPDFPEHLKAKTYALPVRVEILNNQESLFTQKIKDYVVENSRNR
jgi:tetraacyldisaccharide 4'-kinase